MWFFSIGATELEAPAAMLAVAVANAATGPFTYRGRRASGAEHGWGQDLGLFQDDDSRGYLVYDDGYRNIRVDLLADDYLTVSGETVIALKSVPAAGKGFEGSAMAKTKGKYIVASSGVYGWNPTDTTYAVVEAPLGPYREMGLMSAQKTWSRQISNFVTIKESGILFAMCDQWFRGPKGQRVPIDRSCQLWLPVSFDPNANVAKMRHVSQWSPFPAPPTRADRTPATE